MSVANKYRLVNIPDDVICTCEHTQCTNRAIKEGASNSIGKDGTETVHSEKLCEKHAKKFAKKYNIT